MATKRTMAPINTNELMRWVREVEEKWECAVSLGFQSALSHNARPYLVARAVAYFGSKGVLEPITLTHQEGLYPDKSIEAGSVLLRMIVQLHSDIEGHPQTKFWLRTAKN